ncbi:MAG: LCP family protein [Limnochordia bacterium]|jgi:hypothetical protein
MKKWQRLILGGTIVALCLGAYLYYTLHPTRRFGLEIMPIVSPQLKAEAGGGHQLSLPDKVLNLENDRLGPPVPRYIPREREAQPTMMPSLVREEGGEQYGIRTNPGIVFDGDGPRLRPVYAWPRGDLKSNGYRPARQWEPFNVLLLGLDDRHREPSNIDVLVLLRVDPYGRKIDILSHHLQQIGVGNLTEGKIPKTFLQEISNFLGHDLHYYAAIDFAGFKDFMETIGGLTIGLPREIACGQGVLGPGKVMIDDSLALKLAQGRYSGEISLPEMHLLLIQGLAKEMLEPVNLVLLPFQIRPLLRCIVDTNFYPWDLITLAWTFEGLTVDDIGYVL